MTSSSSGFEYCSLDSLSPHILSTSLLSFSPRCFLAPEDLARLRIQWNQWVSISHKDKAYLCKVSPEPQMTPGSVAFERFLEMTREQNKSIPESICLVEPLAFRMPSSKRVEVAVLENREKAENPTLQGAGRLEQRIQKLLLGNLVAEGCVVGKYLKLFPLCLRVTSVDPPGEIATITEATQVVVRDLGGKPQREEKPGESSAGKELSQSGLEDLVAASPNLIGGSRAALMSLFELLHFPLKFPHLFEKLQIECPKGVLLYGPPGVGKTMLVSTVANFCEAKMFIINGPEIFGPYIGDSEAKLRQLFTQAVQFARDTETPTVLFIDEIDALCPHRGGEGSGTDSGSSRVVTQLLTLMDGLESRGRLVVVGATNRPNSIDKALRRPGRFDRELHIPVPNPGEREEILKFHTRGLPLQSDVDMGKLASLCNGYVGADIAALCREASLVAVRRAYLSGTLTKPEGLSMGDFLGAMTKVAPSTQREAKIQVQKVTWDDIGGLAEVKLKLRQAVEWPILHKDTFTRLGLKPPRGVLLYGPPGCSKTTLVKAVATTSNASFLALSGATVFSPYVGDAEKAVRDIFSKARAGTPSIVFLDEIEAMVGKRSFAQGSGGDSVQERVLSTLLNEMDGIEAVDGVLVVGATNRPDMLDPALMRPGRFDELILVPPPDFLSRKAILEVHTRGTPLGQDVDLSTVAKETELFTGAELENLCREASLISLRENHDASEVRARHFSAARTVVLPSMTPELVASYSKLSVSE